jgi:hypothetical protein
MKIEKYIFIYIFLQNLYEYLVIINVFSALPSLPAPVALPYHVAPAGDQPELDGTLVFETLRSLGLKQELGLIRRETRDMSVNREKDC